MPTVVVNREHLFDAIGKRFSNIKINIRLIIPKIYLN